MFIFVITLQKEPSLASKLRKPSIKHERPSTVVETLKQLETDKHNDKVVTNIITYTSASTKSTTTTTTTTSTDENDINLKNVKIEKISIGKNFRKENSIEEISNNNSNKKRQNDSENSLSKKVKVTHNLFQDNIILFVIIMS